MADLDKLLSLASNTAQAAGKRLAAETHTSRQVQYQDATDVKLRADQESEIFIREQLTKATDYPILGEEQGGDPALWQGNTPYWIVDPLDGTYNYLRQAPQCCVSIGLFQGSSPLLGVIHDFNESATYTGIVEQRKFCINNEPVKPTWAASDDQAALMTGFPAGRDYSAPALQTFIQRVQRFKKVRMIGSAALALAYVARARADVYFEESVRLWDVAAGVALVQAAGGFISLKPVTSPALAFDVWAAGKSEWIPEAT